MKNGIIGICLIGAGRAGMIHARNFVSNVPFAKIVAVSDPVLESRNAAMAELGITKAYADYTQALEDSEVDAIVVASPTKFHRDICVAAAKAKKHILCEKPLAMSVSECDEIIAACRENKVKLQVGFMRRFDSSFQCAKQHIINGDIGDVVMVKSNTRGPSKPQPWMYDIKKSNGPLAEVCSHDIDTLRWMTGSEFRRLFAIGGNFRCPDAKADFPDFYDNVILNAEFANGTQGVIDGAQYVKYGYDARVEILGTDGLITLGNTRENSVILCRQDKIVEAQHMESWKGLFTQAYLNEDRAFISCILEDSEPQVTGTDGRMAVAVTVAGNTSITEKRIVELA